MNEFVGDEKNMIFTEDLKNMVHLAEPADLQLVLDMIKKSVQGIFIHILFYKLSQILTNNIMNTVNIHLVLVSASIYFIVIHICKDQSQWLVLDFIKQ